MYKKWTKEEEEYIEKNIKNKIVEEMAKHLNRSCKSVASKYQRMGVYKERWQEEEKQFLREYAGVRSAKWIAKELKRGVSSVEQQINKMGMSFVVDDGRISLFLLIETLGYKSKDSVYKKFEKLGIKTYSVKKKNRTVKMVVVDEFWKWAYKNQDKLDFSRMEHNSLGKEPEWARKKIDRDIREKRMYNRNRKWTKDDESLLLGYLRMGLTNIEISKRLKRTGSSIDAKIRRMNTYYRPDMQEVKKWTEAEEVKLIEMIEDGRKLDDIAYTLNRTSKSIKSKVNRMKKAEIIN